MSADETSVVWSGELGKIAYDVGQDCNGDFWMSAWTSSGEYFCTGGRVPLATSDGDEARFLARVVVYALAAAWGHVWPSEGSVRVKAATMVEHPLCFTSSPSKPSEIGAPCRRASGSTLDVLQHDSKGKA